LASQFNQKKAVVLLKKLGANINRKNKKDETAIMFASEEGNTDIVNYLIEQGAVVNYKSKNNFTALMLAVINNKFETVARLLQAGANPNVTAEMDGETYTPLSYAREQGNTELAALLKRYGTK
jgi:uncharacterized protein